MPKIPRINFKEKDSLLKRAVLSRSSHRLGQIKYDPEFENEFNVNLSCVLNLHVQLSSQALKKQQGWLVPARRAEALKQHGKNQFGGGWKKKTTDNGSTIKNLLKTSKKTFLYHLSLIYPWKNKEGATKLWNSTWFGLKSEVNLQTKNTSFIDHSFWNRRNGFAWRSPSYCWESCCSIWSWLPIDLPIHPLHSASKPTIIILNTTEEYIT